MKKPALLALSVLGLVYCLMEFAAPVALAATSTGSGQALEIAPPLIVLSASPGQTIKTQIKLRDISKTQLLVTNQVNDFVAAGEDGTPKIITGDDSNNPFTVKNWITPVPSLVLSPQQIETLNVTISVPPGASPGGHYGVIRFTGTPPKLEGTGVSLNASLGALVLLTVKGDLKDSLSVAEFSANSGGKKSSLFESAPISFVARIKNDGNVQEQPMGHITVKDMFGKNVATLNVNIPPHNVLPASIRKFESQLGSSTIGNKRLFGRYTATLTLGYGTVKPHTLTDSISFWVIPYKLIAAIVVFLIIAFFVLRVMIRRYNRRIISRAQGSSQRPPAKKTGKKRRFRRKK